MNLGSAVAEYIPWLYPTLIGAAIGLIIGANNDVYESYKLKTQDREKRKMEIQRIARKHKRY